MEPTNASGLLGLLTQKMSYLNQRASVLADNVANADTPGYRSRDLAPFTFGDAMKQADIAMTTTDAKHIIPASLSGAKSKTIKSTETLLDGNSVDLEQEMMKVSQTSVDYQTVTQIYKSITSLFRIAVKGS